MLNEKAPLRSRLLAARAALGTAERGAAERALRDRALELLARRECATVAGYVSIGAEPGTGALLDALRERGVRVLLPVLLPDNDLDWAAYTGPEGLRPARRGLREPAGERLGPAGVLDADALLLPGLAVDRRGLRLGRGGGSYDRVLARLAAHGARPLLAVLLYDTELLDEVPAEPHDRPVDAAVTPSGVHLF
jgi:5-formyltetrahydrofolate cyclo-ligase